MTPKPLDPLLIQIRRDICGGCTLACPVRETIDHAAACTPCPAGRYPAAGDCAPLENPPPKAPALLGDRIERIANPIARAIDRRLGTRISSCGGCAAARRALGTSEKSEPRSAI